MKRYITRWALSTGIRVVEGEYAGIDAKYFSEVNPRRPPRIFVSEKEAFATLEQAVEKAKEMAAKKAKSLKAKAKQLSDPNWEPKVVGE